MTSFVLDVFTKAAFAVGSELTGLSVALSSSPLASHADPAALTFSRFLFLFYSAVLFGFRHSALIIMFSRRNSPNSSSGLPAREQTSDDEVSGGEESSRESRGKSEFTHFLSIQKKKVLYYE